MPEPLPDWYEIPVAVYAEASGSLGVIERGSGLPFDVRRVYWLFGMPNRQIRRGDHAHEALQQVLFCAKGRCLIDLEARSGQRATFELREGGAGLFLNGPVWRTVYDFSPDAAFVALCDREYQYDVVLRDRAEFFAR
jgi:hypothetical protein